MSTTTLNPAISEDSTNHKSQIFIFLLCLSMLSTGACGLINEYVLATVSTFILGNSHKQWSIVIGIMMFMMGIAAMVQNFIKDKNLIEKFIFVEILMALFCSTAPLGVYAAHALMTDHFTLILYCYISIIGFLIGFEIPLIIRINKNYAETLRTNLAYILTMDYVGGFIGMIVWVNWLMVSFPLTEVSFILAGFNFFVAILTYSFFLKEKVVNKKMTYLILAGIAITLYILAYGYLNNRNLNIQLEQKMYDDPIVFTKTTEYQHLVMTHYPTTDDYRLYINGNTQFSSLDEAIYHEQLIHPAMALVPDHAKVLILGGGDGLALREVKKYADVKKITLVDLDPEMTKFAATNTIMTKLNNNAFDDVRVKIVEHNAVSSEGTRPIWMETDKLDNKGNEITEKVTTVNILNLDADKFIGSISESYNVIFIDFPDPNSIELAKLYSKEFFLKLKHRLAENGMMVMQSTSPYHAKETYLAIQRTMNAAGLKTIPFHDNVPSFGDWGWFLIWKSKKSKEQVLSQIDSIEKFLVETRYLKPEAFRSALSFGKGWLTPKFKEINTLMNPVILTYYLNESWKSE